MMRIREQIFLFTAVVIAHVVIESALFCIYSDVIISSESTTFISTLSYVVFHALSMFLLTLTPTMILGVLLLALTSSISISAYIKIAAIHTLVSVLIMGYYAFYDDALNVNMLLFYACILSSAIVGALTILLMPIVLGRSARIVEEDT